MVVPQRAHDRFGEGDGARLDRVALELAPLDPHLREDVERVLDEAPARLFEMRRNEGVVDFAQRTGQLFAVLATPFLAADQAADLAASERDLVRYRAAVVGVLLDQRDEDLVRELTGLAERRVGPDRDALLGAGGVELDFTGAQRGALRVMAEQRAGDAEQIVLHVELVGARRLRCRSFPFCGWHTCALYARRKRAI